MDEKWLCALLEARFGHADYLRLTAANKRRQEAAVADEIIGAFEIMDALPEAGKGLAIVLRECAECGNLIGTKLDGTAPKSCVEHN